MKRTIRFLVEVTTTDPPPDWPTKASKVMKREIGFSFGREAKVTCLGVAPDAEVASDE